MLKVLIVDDSKERVKMIEAAIAESDLKSYVDLHVCENADRARTAMLDSFDVLILDILIPKKDFGTPQALHSVNLLSDITSAKKNYIRPKLIMGLTADISELSTYQENFMRSASVVLDGSLSRLDWLDIIIQQLDVMLNSFQKASRLTSDKVLISVHGIRTHGHWQELLKTEMRKYSRSFAHVEIKYGFFDLLSFIIPPLRMRKARQTAERFAKVLKQHPDKEIYIVAHSFGTLIVSEGLLASSHSNIKTVVLCASPMGHGTNIDHIVDASELTVNDCGIHDGVLVMARVFVLGLGDAGRIGFTREVSDRFLNRYHKGGHDLYFTTVVEGVSFIEKFWLPLLLKTTDVEGYDRRKHYLGQDFFDLFVKVFSYLKPVIYIAVCVACFLSVVFMI